MAGHSAKMQSAREDFARTAQNGAGETGSGDSAYGREVLNDQGGSAISVERDLSPTLRAETHQHLPIVYDICSYKSMKSSNPYSGIYRVNTARTLNTDTSGGSPHCNQGGMLVLFDNHRNDARYTGPCVPDTEVISLAGKPRHTHVSADVAMTLNAADWKDPPAVYSMSKSYHFAHATPDQADALVATDYKCPPVVNADWRVRMIMPVECARLQGFPDWWTDGLTEIGRASCRERV